MGWLKTVQEVVPWLTSLPLLPKLILSGLIIGAAAFVLALIWTPPPELAVKSILGDCYRRALFTRMHAQMDHEAMFASLAECRRSLQQNIPDIRHKGLQDIAVELLATIVEIEHRKPIRGSDGFTAVNKLKLAALYSFRLLAAGTGGRFPLPARGKLAEATFFTRQEADAPPSWDDLRAQQAIDPQTGETVPNQA